MKQDHEDLKSKEYFVEEVLSEKLREKRKKNGEDNPKDSQGIDKVPFSYIPLQVIFEAGLGMMEGGLKYGAHNYREIDIRDTTYFDALMRHVGAYMEGEDIDPKSGINHLSKAIATLLVWRDATMNGRCFDDRPIRPKDKEWLEKLNDKAAELNKKYPVSKLRFIEKGKQ